MGYDCNSAKEMLEALVNDEYCTYIVGKFENYEAILRALRPVFKRVYAGVELPKRLDDARTKGNPSLKLHFKPINSFEANWAKILQPKNRFKHEK